LRERLERPQTSTANVPEIGADALVGRQSAKINKKIDDIINKT
jgi:hypothetical protein